ncbi:MAG TPA: hypothetical protein VGQ45_03935, partial [Gaiellales bacterium]|nr:hypothetical protein [Gaiellales bacterium]
AAAGVTGAAVLGGLDASPAVAMDPRVTSVTLTDTGHVVAKGPINWDVGEVSAVFCVIVQQASVIRVAQSKRIMRGVSGFTAVGPGQGLEHAVCEAYAVALVTHKDGTVEWFDWPNRLVVR